MTGDEPWLAADYGRMFAGSARLRSFFTAWAQSVESARRRPIQIQCGRCGGLSADEQRLIVACGLAPVSLEPGEQILEPIMADTKPVMVLARALNSALAALGWDLPARLFDIPADHPLAQPTLH